MAQPLRILMVSEDVPHPAMGGLGQHAVTLAKAFAKAGHQVDFMGGRRFPYDDEAQATLALPGAFFPDLRWLFGSWKERKLGFFNPLRRAFLARDFARIIMRRAGEYDVIHYHGHVPDVGAFIPASINFVQTRHDQGSDCLMHTRFREGGICTEVAPQACAACIAKKPNFLQTPLSAWAVRQYRNRVKLAFAHHKTVFVSDMLHHNFTRIAGPGPWGGVVHNFTDKNRLEQATAKPIRPEGIAADAKVIVFAGKLYPPKGIEPFLKMAAPKLDTDTYIVVIGDGPQEQALRKDYESSQVQFLGWCSPERTLAYMAGADAVVVPSVCEEAFGQTTFEGLSLGKATFALTRGGTPELQAYEVFPGQLRLFETMENLVGDLIAQHSFGLPCVTRQSRRSVDDAIAELIEVYCSEPPLKVNKPRQIEI